MLLKTIGITATFLALSADAYGFLRYPPPRRVNDRVRPRMRKGLKHLDDREIIRMPVDQFPEKLEGLDFLCRGIPYDEQNVQRYFPGGQIDMMWETGGVSDAVCKIKIVCPAKNYEKELWSGDCATAAGIERRQIFIPPDFECRMGECNLVWLMDTKTQNSFCDCIDIYVPSCANNQCTIITNEESCSTCQPTTTMVTIETVSQASTSTMTQTLETTVDSVVTTTIEDTMTITSLVTSLATDVSVFTLISVIEVTETISGGIVTSLLTTTQTTELTWVTKIIDTLFETSVIATAQTLTIPTTMLQVFTVTVTNPSQVVAASSVNETMVESSTSVAIVTMTEDTTALTEQTTMIETKIIYSEQHAQRYFPGGQIDMMWADGVNDATCKIKNICPVKNYEKELWGGFERRQIVIPSDFKCRMGECNLLRRMQRLVEKHYMEIFYVMLCALVPIIAVMWIFFHKKLPKWKYYAYQELIIGLLGNFAEGIGSALGQGIVDLIRLILAI